MTKQELRKSLKILKDQIPFDEKSKESKMVFEKVEATRAFKEAKEILLYYSLPDELPTHNIVKKWSLAKQILLPRVNGDELEIVPFCKEELKTGSFGIKEPTGNQITDFQDIDLIIVPAVAFDSLGNRLGRGKGYYDKLLPKCKNAYKIGVALNCQMTDFIPSETHDINMDAIFTSMQQIIIKPFYNRPFIK